MKFSVFKIIFLVFLFFLPNKIQAGLVPCGPGTDKPVCEFCDFFVLFKRIIDFLLVPCSLNGGVPLVFLIAILFITIGGFYFLFAEGKPDKLEKGRNIIKTTLIGLLLIFAGWLVVNLFFQVIGVANWTGLSASGPDTWWQIPCD